MLCAQLFAQGQGGGIADTVSAEGDSVPPGGAATDTLRHPLFNWVERALETRQRLTQALVDSLDLTSPSPHSLAQKHKARRRLLQFFGAGLDYISATDSLYIEPQHYNWAFMVQNTTTFEVFTMKGTGKDAQSLSFAPDPTLRLGGYFGWRWLFLGYTFDIGALTNGHRSQNTEIDLSLYSAKIGVDLFWRKTGNDFRMRNLDDLFSEEDPLPSDLSDQFDGLDIETRGFNVYYIFNHRHFSYPAAFSQSTVQRRSCGSFKLGFSYSHHKVALDQTAFDERILAVLDQSMLFERLRYDDYQINFGYSYNWVFARNWLLCVSASPGLAYNVTNYSKTTNQEESESSTSDFLDFRLDKLNIDLTGRLALVWNNTKYFAGCSFIIHTFDYKCSSFKLSNSFGSLNFYVGFNFARKH